MLHRQTVSVGRGPGEMEQRGKSGMVHPSDELGLEEKGIWPSEGQEARELCRTEHRPDLSEGPRAAL